MGIKSASKAAYKQRLVFDAQMRLIIHRPELTYHLPLKVILHQSPLSSVSFSTFVEKEIALIIPSQNFSFITAL